MAVSNIEIKVKGYLRTPLSAEAATTTIDVDFFREDDPSTVVELEADTLMFEIDPLNKTGKGNEIILATSNTFDSPVTNRTRLATVVRGLPLEGHEQTGSATRANSYDAGTEVAIATGTMAKMVNLLISERLANSNDITYSGDIIFSGSLRAPVYATAITRAAGITAPANGMIYYQTDTGVMYQYIGGAWATFATGTTANGSITVAGKFEEATVAEQGTHTATGSTGARLVPACANLVKTGTFTPAYLTGGTGATAVVATWTAVSDGTFTISIDGTEYDITAVDFSTPDADMDAVAATIQAKIRTATSALETVTWSTDHFIISSVDTSSSSAITVTSAEGTGTDISGVGATTFMDCETAVGTVTAKVYDHVNKILVMGTDGLDSENLETNYRGIDTGTTDVTGTELETLTDDSDASDLHNHNSNYPFEGWDMYTCPIGYDDATTDTLNWVARRSGTGAITVYGSQGWVSFAPSATNGHYESAHRYLSAINHSSGYAGFNYKFNSFSAGDKIIYKTGMRSAYPTPVASEVRFGIGEDPADAYSDVGNKCVMKFKMDDTQFSCVTCDGTGAITDTNITVANPDYCHAFEIVWIAGTSVVFKVDGTIVHTATTNIPLITDVGSVTCFAGHKVTSAVAKLAYVSNEPYIAAYIA